MVTAMVTHDGEGLGEVSSVRLEAAIGKDPPCGVDAKVSTPAGAANNFIAGAGFKLAANGRGAVDSYAPRASSRAINSDRETKLEGAGAAGRARHPILALSDVPNTPVPLTAAVPCTPIPFMAVA